VIKQDLIQRVVERTGLPRTKAEDAVDTIFDSMKKTLIAGDRIELRGFGVFTVKPRKTGIGRNPRTGTEVSIAPGKAVRFKRAAGGSGGVADCGIRLCTHPPPPGILQGSGLECLGCAGVVAASYPGQRGCG
jgi:DNA-binding protein HU-beta